MTAATKPAFGRPDIGEVGHPFLVRSVGCELAIQDVGHDDRSVAGIFRQTAPPWSRSERVLTHQPLNAMKTARQAFSQHIMPDTPGTIGSVAVLETLPNLVQQNLIVAGMVARRAIEPGMEAGTRNPQRFAEPCHRPDRTVLCNKRKLHIASLAK